MLTDHVSEEGRVLQQIHIPEYLAEVRCKFPKSAANTQSPSEPTINMSDLYNSRHQKVLDF